jgi:hypothetical protein
VRELLLRLSLIELVSPVLERAREPLPVVVRTFDALHLASIEFLREHGQDVRLASFDERQVEAARAMDIEVVPL